MKKYSLTSFQYQIYSICKEKPDVFAYNIPASISIKGKINSQALQKSVTALVKCHPEISTVIMKKDNTFYQTIGKNELIHHQEINQEHLGDALEHEAKTPISPTGSPLTRIKIWEINNHHYVVQITISHIIADRTSLSILFETFWQHYEHYSENSKLEYTTSPTFFDFLESSHTPPKEQLSYWKKTLSGLDIKNYIPHDYNNSSPIYSSGGIKNKTINEALHKEIKKYCKTQKITPFTFFASCLNALFMKISGNNDIAMGTAISTRPIKYFNAFGPFVNTILLRTTVTESTNYADLIFETNNSINDALENSEIAFHEAFSSAQNITSENTQGFQCMYVFQGADFESKKIDETYMQLKLINNRSAKFDLNFYIFDTGQSFKIKLEYAKIHFSKTTVSNLLRSLSKLSEKIISNDKELIKSEIFESNLSPARKYEAGERTPYPKTPLITKEINKNLIKFETEKAIIEKDRFYTYKQVEALKNNVIKNLKKFKIKENDIIAIYSHRSAKLIPIILALWEIGGIYLPIEASSPKERTATIINEANPALLVLQKYNNRARAVIKDQPSLQTTSFNQLLKDSKDILPPYKAISASTGAYLIFTSGSTGAPKGVLINHRGLYNRINWMRSFLRISSHDTIFQKTSLMFDVSIWELVLSLFSGACMLIAAEDKNSDPTYLASSIQTYQVTVMHFVPVFLDASLPTFKQYDLSSLKHVICSGDTLKPSTVTKFYKLIPSAWLHNLYGPTEASIDVSFFTCPKKRELCNMPIGLPIWNTTLFLTTPNGKIINDHLCPGELMIAGDGLSSGYYKKESLSCQKFIFIEYKNQKIRVYKSGDLAMWSLNGELLFLGRIDRQIKIRGIRIEATELENKVCQYPSIISAYVCKNLDDNNNENLIAYIMAKNQINISLLRAFLANFFPDIMLPNYIITLESFPFMASGKIDIKQLPPPPSSKQLDANHLAEKDSFSILSHILKSVLSVNEISPEDNYFSLGGDSIKSIQVISAARKFGFYFTVSDFLETPDIKNLSEYRHQNDSNSNQNNWKIEPFSLLTKDDRKAIQKLPNIDNAYPLSHLQKSLVFHSEMDENYSVYITTFRIFAKFDKKLWDQALLETQKNFPIMRTYFDLGSYNEPIQIVQNNTSCSIQLSYHNLQKAQNKSERIASFIEKEKHRVFNWEKVPLFRFYIHQLGKNEIQLTMSEPCLDGWSVSLIASTIFKHYIALITGSKYEYISPKTTISDAVKQEQIALNSKKHLSFWKTKEKNYKLSIINKTPQDTATSFRYAHKFSYESSRRLEEFSQNHKIPIKSILLSMHCLCIASLLKQERITTGIMANLRPETQDAERVAYIFLNVLPISINTAGETLTSLGRKLVKVEAEINKYRQTPYGSFLSKAQNKSFDTIFNFTNFHPYKEFIQNKDFSVSEIHGTDQTFFDITIQLTLLPVEKRFRLAIDFNRITKTGELSKRIISTFMETFEKNLNEMESIKVYE